MERKHNIDLCIRAVKDMIAEIERGQRAYFYCDFLGGMENEQELIDELREVARAHGLAFEVEYDDGELVIWFGERDYLTAGAGES